MGLVFNTRIRRHDETEHECVSALKQLALYAYKDASQYHIEQDAESNFLPACLLWKGGRI